MGSDYLAYTLLDIVVDQYFVVLEKLGERIEFLEGKLLADPGTTTLQKIQTSNERCSSCENGSGAAGSHQQPGAGEFPGFKRAPGSTLGMFTTMPSRSWTHRIYRDMLSGMLDIYLSSLNNG